MNNNISFRFWSYAKEFLAAADAVKVPPKSNIGKSAFKLLLPAYYLVGHSVELTLKSFLLAKGYEIDKLKKGPYGHNLEELLREARRRKIGRHVKLSKIEDNAIKLLSRTYSAKKFEYMEYGNYHLPEYWYIHTVAQKLVNGLRYYSSNSPFNKRLHSTRNSARP
jgi:HEPN domain-containing protein